MCILVFSEIKSLLKQENITVFNNYIEVGNCLNIIGDGTQHSKTKELVKLVDMLEPYKKDFDIKVCYDKGVTIKPKKL